MECHHAARRAADLGYTNLYIMPAGIVGWQKANMPVVTGDKPGH
jgi:rhodanese-related sulfurtransferase